MSKTTKPPVRIAKITNKAHKALPELSDLIAREKGLSGLNYIETASLAILEALQKRKRGTAAEKENK